MKKSVPQPCLLKMDQTIVITTINPPRDEITAFSKIKDWQLICVGDTKTPPEWAAENVVYLSPKQQEKLYPELSAVMPWKRYARKNLGYLFSIQNGAKVIGETDDDVFPYKNFPPNTTKEMEIEVLSGEKFINIYKLFADGNIWPRGFPIDELNKEEKLTKTKKKVKALIQNSVIDQDTDFDAIYRLLYNDQVKFSKEGAYALEKGSYCPMNSQNTFFHPEAYPLLYIPAFANGHVEDIWRGYIAQRLLWELGGNLVFSHTTTYTSDRNPHDYLKDFELELPIFLHTKKLVQILDNLSLSADPFSSMIKTYKELVKEGILPEEELPVLREWLTQLIKFM